MYLTSSEKVRAAFMYKRTRGTIYRQKHTAFSTHLASGSLTFFENKLACFVSAQRGISQGTLMAFCGLAGLLYLGGVSKGLVTKFYYDDKLLS